MIIHNSDYTTNAQAPAKTVRVRLTEVTDGTPLVLTNEDDLQSVVMNSVGSYLGTATKKITVKALNLHSELAGLTFDLSVGILNPTDSTWDDITIGRFYTDSVTLDYENTNTTAILYDAMYTATQKKYEASDYSFPCTVQQLAEAVTGTVLNIELASGFNQLPNADYTITEDLYSNITDFTTRDVIDEIAKTTATTAIIDSTGKLKFVPFTISSEVMTSDNLMKLTIGKHYGVINSVVLSRMPQEDNITQNGSTVNEMEVTSVNTTTNLLTIVGNGMSNGTIVKLKTTDTMPAPLIEGKVYFVFTNGNADTFSLHHTYADAMAGDNAIVITSEGEGELYTMPTERTEMKIANVEILDDERQATIQPIFNALYGVEFDGMKAETEGHGWYEVGDVIAVTQDGKTYYPYITEVILTLEGGMKETIICTPPDPTKTNYQRAGGILKTLYNTEIKVDKQEQEIVSVVEQVDTIDETVSSNFSQIQQTIEDITTTIQHTGGANLLLNSVGYAKDVDGVMSFWTYGGDEEADSAVSNESMQYGAISGSAISITGTTTLSQRVIVQAGHEYAFGFRAKKNATGSVTVHLQNTIDDYTLELEESTAYLWNEFSLVDVLPSMDYFDVIIEADEPDSFYITDLRLINGKELTQWSQAVGEVTNTSVQVTADGMIVRSSVYDGDFTAMTPIEFAGYSSVSGSQERVFYLNRDETYAKKLKAQAQITMLPIKIVPILSGDRAGWAFVETTE